MSGALSPALVRDLDRLVAGAVWTEASLAPWTTLRQGGPADVVIAPSDQEHLVHALQYLSERGVPMVLLGNGSHVILPDRGLHAVVVRSQRLHGLRRRGTQVWAEAGVTLSALAAFSEGHGLAGLEFSADIPGRVGGAVALNAGAYGFALSDRLLDLWLFVPGEGIRRLPAAQSGFRPHASSLPSWQCTVLAASFALTPEVSSEAIAERRRALTLRRRARQPQGWPTFGCMFRNPPGAPAGRLLEEAGVKGMRVGDLCISRRHANFMLNLGAGGYDAIRRLLEAARERVLRREGVELALEVRVIDPQGHALPDG